MKQMQMGPWGWKNTVFSVRYNKFKHLHSCSDLLFCLQKEQASLNHHQTLKKWTQQVNFKTLQILRKLIFERRCNFMTFFFFFGEISKTFCKVKYRALPAIMQNQFVSFLSSDTETKPTHLIYKMYWLGLLPGWFPASLASFHVFLPMRHMKTILFCFVF